MYVFVLRLNILVIASSHNQLMQSFWITYLKHVMELLHANELKGTKLFKGLHDLSSDSLFFQPTEKNVFMPWNNGMICMSIFLCVCKAFVKMEKL